MFIPTDKYCPLLPDEQGRSRPCLGELCGWFDRGGKQCAVVSTFQTVRKTGTAKVKKAAE